MRTTLAVAAILAACSALAQTPARGTSTRRPRRRCSRRRTPPGSSSSARWCGSASCRRAAARTRATPFRRTSRTPRRSRRDRLAATGTSSRQGRPYVGVRDVRRNGVARVLAAALRQEADPHQRAEELEPGGVLRRLHRRLGLRVEVPLGGRLRERGCRPRGLRQPPESCAWDPLF